jgi:hypothetical protein
MYGLSSMQGRYEDDLVVVLQDVIAFSLQLPIGVVDQDEDAGASGVHALGQHRLKHTKLSSRITMQDPHRVVFHEELASLFEQIVFQPMYQIIHIGGFAIDSRGDLNLV